MAQLDPIRQYNKVAYFYAHSGAPDLGRFSKDANAAVLCRLDYSQLPTTPSGAGNYSFNVDIGSNPPLAVTSAYYDDVNLYLDFILSGGVEGQGYVLTVELITANGTVINTLEIDVPLTSGCGATSYGMNDANYPIGEGMVFINSAPKYTVSSAIPSGANVKDQWYSSDTGTLFEYVTDGVTYWWQQLTPSTIAVTAFQTLKILSIDPDGFSTQFTLLTIQSKSPNILVSTDLLVSVDDVIQEPDVAYKAFSDQIQFTVPPTADSRIFMIWFAHH
jgi:hypothetical protein